MMQFVLNMANGKILLQAICKASADMTQHHISQGTQCSPSAQLYLACRHRMVAWPFRTRLSVPSLPSLVVKETLLPLS